MLKRPEPGSIPDRPGSYQFKDGEGRILYVGKAKSLRQRLSSYFHSTELLPLRTQLMLSTAEGVEWIQVNNDVEALILEYNLIKRHKPRYNIRLRDDKSYPYLALTIGDEWPRATVMRGKKQAGVKYFGPYPHVSAIRTTLELLVRSFPLRTCSDAKFNRQSKLGQPCLLFHIQRCVGPCIGAVEHSRYQTVVESIAKVLRGDVVEIIKGLESQMRVSSAELDFETAARVRDSIESVKKVASSQEVVIDSEEDLDVVGYFDDELEVCVQVFHVRKGRLIGRKGFVVEKVEELAPMELMEKLLEIHYSETAIEIPPLICIPSQVSDPETITGWLSTERGAQVKLRVPVRGSKRRLVELANSNSKEEFRRQRFRRATDHNSRSQALNSLARELQLSQSPLRIECYDMSHLQGTNYVGSMVVMEDGLLKRSEYRKFKVSVPQNDDYAAMEEVLTRRLGRLKEPQISNAQDKSNRFAYRPNLLLIDGGKGQLNVAKKVMERLGIGGEIEVASLAKEFEEIYIPDCSEPIRLLRNSPALFLLQQLRDEAHRFAITYHRNRRSRSHSAISLDSTPGLGPRRREKLLAHFGSLTKLKSASNEELLQLDFLPTNVANGVYLVLHGLPGDNYSNGTV